MRVDPRRLAAPRLKPPPSRTLRPPRKPRREIPYWLLAAALLGVLFLWLIVADGDYRIIFSALRQGVLVDALGDDRRLRARRRCSA